MATQLNPVVLADQLLNKKGGSIDSALAELNKTLDSQRYINSDMVDVLEETRDILLEEVAQMQAQSCPE